MPFAKASNPLTRWGFWINRFSLKYLLHDRLFIRGFKRSSLQSVADSTALAITALFDFLWFSFLEIKVIYF